MQTSRKIVIIMGAARSGTTWLQAMLAAHEVICTASELFLYVDYTSKWTDSYHQQVTRSQHNVKIGLPVLWMEQQLIEQLRAFVNSVYDEVAAKKPGARIVVDKTPSYTHYVEHILTLIPDVHFIHVIRDGRDVVSSTLATAQSWGSHWASRDVRRICKQWIEAVQNGRLAQKIDQQYTEIRYEDLLHDGVATLERVFDAIGLHIDRERAKQIYDAHTIEQMRQRFTLRDSEIQTESGGIFLAPKSFYRQGTAGNWHRDLNVLQLYIIYITAGKLLRELDYTDDSKWWYRRRHERWLIPIVAKMTLLINKLTLPIRRHLQLRQKLQTLLNRSL